MVSPFVKIYDIISLHAAELEEPKIDISSKGSRNLVLEEWSFLEHYRIVNINVIHMSC